MFIDLPSDWEPMNGKPMKRVPISPNSAEYKEVEKRFKKSAPHYTIKEVSSTITHLCLLGLVHLSNALSKLVRPMLASGNTNLNNI